MLLLLQLRERLALLKIAKSEEQERKKKGIAASKEVLILCFEAKNFFLNLQAKEKLLQEAMTTINRHKEAQAAIDKIK